MPQRKYSLNRNRIILNDKQHLSDSPRKRNVERRPKRQPGKKSGNWAEWKPLVAYSRSIPPCFSAKRALILCRYLLTTDIALGLRKDTLSLSVHGISQEAVIVLKVDVWPALAQPDEGHFFMTGRRGCAVPLLKNWEACCPTHCRQPFYGDERNKS